MSLLDFVAIYLVQNHWLSLAHQTVHENKDQWCRKFRGFIIGEDSIWLLLLA